MVAFRDWLFRSWFPLSMAVLLYFYGAEIARFIVTQMIAPVIERASSHQANAMPKHYRTSALARRPFSVSAASARTRKPFVPI